LISLGACSLTVSTVFVLVMTVCGIFISMSIYHRRIYAVRYLLAGLFGPLVQSIVYICVALLLQRQWEPKFFINLWNGLIS
jgi:ABC-type spermidine/putrescine transport system permease subunit II